MDHINIDLDTWRVETIAVIGPGIVGMPMAAMLAHARICQGGQNPARVIVVQRNSPTSGWKVDAINAGHSVIGGIEPELDRITKETVQDGLLSATHDYKALTAADVILVCVQTDKKGLGPDYGPMFAALSKMAEALQDKPADKIPLIVFESTLAPSSMITVIKDHFEKYGLIEGRDILLGNSPNRVMPGRLVERIARSDKLIGGLHPQTPALIDRIYSSIVTQAKLYTTNSLTAEVIKTLENAYRDVRVAFAAEIARYCDNNDIDFYQVRDQVNARLAQEDAASDDPNAVPSGGVLVPTVGVGGHCLPKDGILMSWRRLEKNDGIENSLILEARKINDESPAETVRLAESHFGVLDGKSIALLGTAYRFNSEDTRNSPTLPLAHILIEKGCSVTLHDPYVRPDDQKLMLFNLQDRFASEPEKALSKADYLFFCTAHKVYAQDFAGIAAMAPTAKGIVDGCNLYQRADAEQIGLSYAGIGRGLQNPTRDFIDFVYDSFRAMEKGVANEVNFLVDFLNTEYADSPFNQIKFEEVQHIAGTCVTGCAIVDPAPVTEAPSYDGFVTRLAACAAMAKK